MDARWLAEEITKLFVPPIEWNVNPGQMQKRSVRHAIEGVKELVETYYEQQLEDRKAMEEKIKLLQREYNLRGERILWLERALGSKR